MHVFKMAGKITHFFSSKSGKESQDKEPSNGIQPLAKKVCSNSTASKVYDGTLRVRKFLPKWENDFPWIQFTEGKMFCKYCLEVNMRTRTALSIRVRISSELVLFVLITKASSTFDALMFTAPDVTHKTQLKKV